MPDQQDTRTVEETYNIDGDKLHIRSGEYWDFSSKFYHQVKNNLYTSLSDKQKKWLMKIERSLNADNCR